MNIIKNSHRQIHRLSFRLLISDHGVVINRLLLFLLALPLSTAQRETDPPPPLPDKFGALEQRFDPSMAIIMVVVVSVVFLVGFFSIYIRRCAQRQVRPNNNNTADPFAIFLTVTNRRSRRTAPGLEASVLKTFPTFLYSAVKGHKIGKVSLECAVCLNEFEDDETLRLIPKCSHVFHPDCIDAWLASHTTCPVCRANLVPEAGETISSVSVQLFNPDNPTGQPEQRSDNIEEISQADAEQSERRDVETVDANLINQNTPPAPARSRSTGWRLTNLFPRSHSTGQLSIQPGENCERFTLRLPAEVRSQLIMNSSLIRSQSCVAFPRVRSSRRGFRSGSGSGGGGGLGLPRNSHYYERFNNSFKSDRKETVMGGSTATAITPPPQNLFKSIKSTSNSLLAGRDCDGERSFDRLRRDNQV